MTITLDLPADGVVTRPAFDALPRPNHGWAWELHDGRLELVYRPVTHWHWIVRGDPEADEVDGMITMYELRGGSYEVVGNKLASHLDPDQA